VFELASRECEVSRILVRNRIIAMFQGCGRFTYEINRNADGELQQGFGADQCKPWYSIQQF